MSTATLPGRPTRVPDLARVLLGGPELRGAACAARAPLWDDRVSGRETGRDRTDRHRAAITICHSCPVRVPCLERRLEDPTLGAGVYGGRVFRREPAGVAA
ncbi:MAG: WhiB family transcriptional regulator [Pseudonocardiaceae bacterium]